MEGAWASVFSYSHTLHNRENPTCENPTGRIRAVFIIKL